MRDGVCLRASQGAKEETPPSRSLQSSEGLTASDKSRRSRFLSSLPTPPAVGGERSFPPRKREKIGEV